MKLITSCRSTCSTPSECDELNICGKAGKPHYKLLVETITPAPTVHVIAGTEHERGWGCRPDGYVAFTSKLAAYEWIDSYNKRFNSSPRVPDEYTTYDYVGIKECSQAFLNEVGARGLKHFERSQELTA